MRPFPVSKCNPVQNWRTVPIVCTNISSASSCNNEERLKKFKSSPAWSIFVPDESPFEQLEYILTEPNDRDVDYAKRNSIIIDRDTALAMVKYRPGGRLLRRPRTSCTRNGNANHFQGPG
jgi:hypothetical protein